MPPRQVPRACVKPSSTGLKSRARSSGRAIGIGTRRRFDSTPSSVAASYRSYFGTGRNTRSSRMLLSAQVAVDRRRSLVTGRDRSDAAARTGDHLAAREDAGFVGGHDRTIHRKQTALGEEEVRTRNEVLERGALADREDDDVAREVGEPLAELGREAPYLVEDRQALSHAHAHHVPVLDKHFLGTDGTRRDNALVERLFDLPGMGGHLGLGLERRQPDLGCADTQRATRAVDGDVAASDDEHALVANAGLALPVRVPQERERAQHAFCLGPRYREDPAFLQPDSDEHGVELPVEMLERYVLPDLDAVSDLDAHLDQVVDLPLKHVARQTIRRHARNRERRRLCAPSRTPSPRSRACAGRTLPQDRRVRPR